MRLYADDKEETLFFIFKIKEGYRDRVIERFETHIKHSRTEEGNLLFDFYTIDGYDNTFVVYENWRSKSALFDIEIPEINTVYVHILGHDLHSEILGPQHLESSIVSFKNYLDQGYTSFLSSQIAFRTLRFAYCEIQE